jgi:cystathionine beta-lyase
VDDLIDDLRTALVQAGAVTVTVDGLKAGVPPAIAEEFA